MNKQQKQYMTEAIASFAVKAEKKFRKGQKEHGGNFWEKSGMLKNAEDEALDFWYYIFNLRHQMYEMKPYLTHPKAIDSWEKIMSDICN